MTRPPPYSPASARNSEPILGVLRFELANCHSLLEIGSGTAQHAVTFAAAMPWLNWQTSDLAENHEGIKAQLAGACLSNVQPPSVLDMNTAVPVGAIYDAVYSSNTLHIMNEAAGKRMLPFVSSILRDGGMFCYYGPFKRDGRCTTASNESFDQSLRERKRGMGLRELEQITELAHRHGLVRQRIYAMPANNLLIAWQQRHGVAAEKTSSQSE
ncbi:MAG TPA: DUF938 domain-containing protein [Woeseiaceae bacterium]|nr:DUF938 domain-containing protein [Woeseiaceae bacterium]